MKARGPWRAWWARVGPPAAAGLPVWPTRPPPASLAGLRSAGPYAVLAAAAALAWGFNRGRCFVIAATLLVGYTAWQFHHSKVVFTAVVLIVPLNTLLVMLYPERGAKYRAAYVWIALLAAEGALLWWLGTGHPRWSFDSWWLRSPPP